METKNYTIQIFALFNRFPDFIFRDAIAEIVGYNPKTHTHMVINSGMCVSEDNKWLVHQYKIKDPENFNWMEYKYVLDERIAEHVMEEWVEF